MGVYAVIRIINQHTRPPVNTLERTGDIELIDYIEPTQPQQIYYYPDLLEPVFPIYERIPRVPSYWSGTPPSYRSGTLPSYQSNNRWFINSSLEDSINLDFIFIIFVFFLIYFYIFCFFFLVVNI